MTSNNSNMGSNNSNQLPDVLLNDEPEPTIKDVYQNVDISEEDAYFAVYDGRLINRFSFPAQVIKKFSKIYKLDYDYVKKEIYNDYILRGNRNCTNNGLSVFKIHKIKTHIISNKNILDENCYQNIYSENINVNNINYCSIAINNQLYLVMYSNYLIKFNIRLELFKNNTIYNIFQENLRYNINHSTFYEHTEFLLYLFNNKKPNDENYDNLYDFMNKLDFNVEYNNNTSFSLIKELYIKILILFYYNQYILKKKKCKYSFSSKSFHYNSLYSTSHLYDYKNLIKNIYQINEKISSMNKNKIIYNLPLALEIDFSYSYDKIAKILCNVSSANKAEYSEYKFYFTNLKKKDHKFRIRMKIYNERNQLYITKKNIKSYNPFDLIEPYELCLLYKLNSDIHNNFIDLNAIQDNIILNSIIIIKNQNLYSQIYSKLVKNNIIDHNLLIEPLICGRSKIYRMELYIKNSVIQKLINEKDDIDNYTFGLYLLQNTFDKESKDDLLTIDIVDKLILNKKNIHFKINDNNISPYLYLFNKEASFNNNIPYSNISYVNMLKKEYSELFNIPFEELDSMDEQTFKKKILYKKSTKKFDLTDKNNIKKFEKIEKSLFDYQKNNVLWMNEIENKIKNNNFEFSIKLVPNTNNCCNRLRNIYIKNFMNENYVLKQDYHGKLSLDLYSDFRKSIDHTIQFKGGVLCDEVGLGKTLSCVTHIVSRIDIDKEDYQNGKFDANNLIILPSRLISQWVFEIEQYLKDKKILKICKILTINDIRKLKTKVNSNKLNDYDIYIISSNLFINENYIKLLTNEYNTIRIKGDLDKYVKDIINVIQDRQDDLDCLKNEKYISKIDWKKTDIYYVPNKEVFDFALYEVIFYKNILKLEGKTNSEVTHTLIDTENYQYRGNFKSLKIKLEKIISSPFQKEFNVFNINWNRIIIDEIHELLKQEPDYCITSSIDYINTKKITTKQIHMSNIVTNKLKSNFKWGLSATPFEYGVKNLINLFKFFMDKNTIHGILYNSSKEKDKLLMANNEIEYCVNDYKSMTDIFNNIFRQTMKKDVRDDIKIPIFNEKIEWIKQSNIERNVYNSFKSKYMNQSRYTLSRRQLQSQSQLRNPNYNDGTNEISYDNIKPENIKNLFQLCTNLCISNELNDCFEEAGTDVLSLTDLNKLMIRKFNKQIEKNNQEINTKTIEKNIIYEYIEKINMLYDILKNKFKGANSTYKHISIINNYFHYDIRNQNTTNRYTSYAIFPEVEALMQSIISTININNISIDKINDMIVNISNLIHDYSFTYDLRIRNLNKVEKEYFIYKSLQFIINRQKSLFTTREQSIENIRKENDRLERQTKLFESNDFIKEKTNDPCMICFEDFEGEVVVTKCRHVFCGNCFKIMASNKKVFPCPECRGDVQVSNITTTTMESIRESDKKPEPRNENNETSEENPVNNSLNFSKNETLKNECINKYGTKMAVMIEKLQKLLENQDNRVIIFSQYDKMLKLIGNTLKEYKIKNVFCKGQVHHINKSIDKFKRDPSYRVIMLSSEKANSGSNLTEANNIFLIDVFNANADQTKDMEAQAIGRAVRLGQKKPVTVTRFITKDTIEEDFYNKNKYDIKEYQ